MRATGRAAFVHRTGHSIGEETHGNGANMDNLETHDTRRVMPRTSFSVKLGIYLPEFGVRSEVTAYVGADGEVRVTEPKTQERVLRVLGSPEKPGYRFKGRPTSADKGFAPRHVSPITARRRPGMESGSRYLVPRLEQVSA